MAIRRTKRKGDQFERDLATYFSHRLGVSVQRSLYTGDPYIAKKGSADLIGLPGLSVEAKRTEQLRVFDAMEQARRNAGKEEAPAVVHRRARQSLEDAHVIMPLSEFMRFYRAWGIQEGFFRLEKFNDDDWRPTNAGAPQHPDEQAQVNA